MNCTSRRSTRRRQPTHNLLERAVATFERNFLIRELEKHDWNVTATAGALGIPLSTLKFKMDRLDIRSLARKVRNLTRTFKGD